MIFLVLHRSFKCLTFMSDSFSFHSYETRPSNTNTSTRSLHSNTCANGNSPHRFNFCPSAHSTPEIPTMSVHKYVNEASCNSQSTINSGSIPNRVLKELADGLPPIITAQLFLTSHLRPEPYRRIGQMHC